MTDALPSSRRPVITGLGVVSCLGNSTATVADALRAGRSGVTPVASWQALGLRSTVAGQVSGIEEMSERFALPPRERLAMSRAALYAVLATHGAVEDAALTASDLGNPRVGVVVGSGVGDTTTIHRGAAQVEAGRPRQIEPYAILKSMSNAPSAALVRRFGAGGRSYSLASACATSTHAIGHAAELVRGGRCDVVIAGGCEEIDDPTAAAFSALRSALSSHWNDRPAEASRPFAADRDGFVLASGAAIVVVESLTHAQRRGARIHAEVAGFGANSDGFDWVLPEPSGERAAACMREALDDAQASPDEVDYVNAHATATLVGDVAEAAALRRVFGARLPPISSTKSLGGHALGAAGAIEVIHCALMLNGGFLAGSRNSKPRDPALADLPVIATTRDADVRLALTNSFGFGGTHAVLALRRFD
jgi:3-oxoacyl-[acyl-carrier-protein] synthase-1